MTEELRGQIDSEETQRLSIAKTKTKQKLLLGPKEARIMGAGVREEQPLLEMLAKGLQVEGDIQVSPFFPLPASLSLADPVRVHCHGSLGNTACKDQHPRGGFRRETEQVRDKE